MLPHWHENKPYFTLVFLLGVMGVLFLGAKTLETLKESSEVGKPEPQEYTISFSGEGRVVGRPDIAEISFGVLTRAADVPTAQSLNAETMNALLGHMEELGISDDDIRTTNYQVYEDRIWDPQTGEYRTTGWVVSQRVDVKVRDEENVSQVITVAGQNGATDISGPNFTIDDPSDLRDAARRLAIDDAMERAEELADELGIELGDVIGFSDSDGGFPPVPFFAEDQGRGLGGGTAPDLAPGSDEVIVNVTLTYRLR